MSIIAGLHPMNQLDTINPGLMITGMNFYPTNGLNSWTGYGRLELGVARGLTQHGIDLHIYPKNDAPTLVIGYAGWLEAPAYAHTRRWILTQSESTRVSQKWVDLINWHAEGVLVTNPDLVSIYGKSGVERPVFYAGHGVDLSVPVQADGWDGESRFEWLTYSYGDMRKGGELAIMAFKRMYQDDERHHLTIKARDGAQATWLRGLKDPQITVVFGQQSEHEWMQLLARSHCFIFPSRAEGFGMPPREATLAGVPTIATDWLGMADVDKWGLPIKVKELRPTQYDFEEANDKNSQWAEPDLDHLESQMEWVYANYNEACEVARRGRWYIRAMNDWRVVAGRIIDAVESLS